MMFALDDPWEEEAILLDAMLRRHGGGSLPVSYMKAYGEGLRLRLANRQRLIEALIANFAEAYTWTF